MSHDYPLRDFANRLANVEEKYAKEIQGLVECFCGSRVDLPVKKFEDLARARKRTAKRLRNSIDYKNGELHALWKFCNIYSSTAVDVDNAMRETRDSLRKRIKPKDPSPFRRILVMDDYRPANKQSTKDAPQDIYDTDKPQIKERSSILSNIFRRPAKETRKIAAIPDSNTEQLNYNPTLLEAVKLNYRSEEKRNVLPPKPPQIACVASPPEPPPIPPTERISAAQASEAVNGMEYGSIVKTRISATKEKVEETKRLSLLANNLGQMENESRKPPVAPPRKEKRPSIENQTNTLPTNSQPTKRMSPALPPRPREEGWKKQESLKTVPPTVIQLDDRALLQPTPAPIQQKRVENMTNIQVEDVSQQRILPSPQTTIRVSGEEPVAMSPKVSNDRVQKFQPESVPPRQVQKGQIISFPLHQLPERQTSIDRF